MTIGLVLLSFVNWLRKATLLKQEASIKSSRKVSMGSRGKVVVVTSIEDNFDISITVLKYVARR